MQAAFNIISLNETALIIGFGNCIDEAINKKVIALWQQLCKKPFIGFIEAVPAYAELTVFYDVLQVKKNYPRHSTAFDAVKNYVQSLPVHTSVENTARTITIPVLYNGADLAIIAEEKKLPVEEIIRLHTSQKYIVYMLGFLPGFAYMGSVHQKIAMPRKEKPLTQVPAGSIGIAGMQTGIYPSASPGGWQLIGQTPLKIFDTKKTTPCLLRAGDEILFTSITKEAFDTLNEY